MATTLTLPNEAQASTEHGVVEIDVQLTPLDMYRAERTVVWRQVRWMMALAAAFVLLRILAGGGMLLFIVVALLGVFCFVVHSGFIYMAARSTLRTNRVLRGVIHYSFEPNCMHSRGETFWSTQDWSNLHEVLETRHLLIIRSSSAQKVVIPKRYLLGDNLKRVRALARKLPPTPLTPDHATRVLRPGPLTASARLGADDLYQGFLLVLLRKSHWYAAQLVFSWALFFAVNPRLFSPTLFVVIGSGFIFITAIALYRASSRAIRTNAAYQSAIAYSFGPSGLEASGSTFAFHHDWCNFRSVIEGSKIFVFCPSNAQMIVVPKRSFTDAPQIAALRQLLRAHVQAKLSLKH
jgi:hypothetical protein